MNLQRTLDHLLPARETDSGFLGYLGRLSVSGLKTLGVVEVAAALVQHVGRADAGGVRLPQLAAMTAIGLLTLGVASLSWGRKVPRLIGWVSAWLATTVLLVGGADEYTFTAVLLVLVTAVASIPFLPWHAFALGIAAEAMYILSDEWVLSSGAAHSGAHHIMLVLLALLATGIAASNHAHRQSEFAAHQESVRVAETLTGAQLRAQLAENAISIGKMAAALSHEINSPLGALRSSVATLCLLTDRQIEATPEERARLEGTREDLRRSIEESAARMEEVARRLRRFVSLEEAEVKSADINDLLTDVTLLYRDEIDRRQVQLDFALASGLPNLNCRPQLLTAAFSSLLSNALQAVNGNGKIAIETRGRAGEIEITVRDNGRGMSAEEADTIFDPAFKVAEGRVSSGNWSLFNSRQIVYEHGGEIRLETSPGKGTAMHVTLPLV
jgi:signal transduction histidine kinase